MHPQVFSNALPLNPIHLIIHDLFCVCGTLLVLLSVLPSLPISSSPKASRRFSDDVSALEWEMTMGYS